MKIGFAKMKDDIIVGAVWRNAAVSAVNLE